MDSRLNFGVEATAGHQKVVESQDWSPCTSRLKANATCSQRWSGMAASRAWGVAAHPRLHGGRVWWDAVGQPGREYHNVALQVAVASQSVPPEWVLAASVGCGAPCWERSDSCGRKAPPARTPAESCRCALAERLSRARGDGAGQTAQFTPFEQHQRWNMMHSLPRGSANMIGLAPSSAEA